MTVELAGFYENDPELLKSSLNKTDLDKKSWSTAWDEETKLSLLFMACLENKPEIVKYLLNEGANPNLGSSTDTPLTIACKMQYVEIVKLLLEANAEETPDMDGNTPLLLAFTSGSDAMVEAFSPDLRDLNRYEQNEAIPLKVACEQGWLFAVKQLLNKKVDYPVIKESIRLVILNLKNCSNEQRAIYEEILSRLLEKFNLNEASYQYLVVEGGNLLDFIFNTDESRYVAKASKINFIKEISVHSKLAIALIKKFLDIKNDHLRESKLSAFMTCLSTFYALDLAKAYLKEGVSIDGTCYDTAWNHLLIACLKENIEAVKAILESSIEDNTNDIEAISPLEIAYFTGNEELIALLKKYKITNIDTTNELTILSYYGHTKLVIDSMNSDSFAEETREEAFEAALIKQHTEIAEIILELDKGKVLKDEMYDYAFDLAFSSGNVDLIKKIIKTSGASISSDELLSLASLHNCTDYALELLNLGADPLSGKYYDISPLARAIHQDNFTLAKAMISAIPDNHRFKSCIKYFAVIAARKGSLEILDELLKLNTRQEYLDYCLVEAAKTNQLEAVRFLIKKGAKLAKQEEIKVYLTAEAKENSIPNLTALAWVVKFGFIDIMHELLPLCDEDELKAILDNSDLSPWSSMLLPLHMKYRSLTNLQSPSFLIRLLSHPAMKVGAGLLLGLGLAALAVGTFGMIAPLILGLASTITMAMVIAGGTASVVGAGLLAGSIFATKSMKNDITEEQSKPLAPL